jgi:hypothetical protein
VLAGLGEQVGPPTVARAEQLLLELFVLQAAVAAVEAIKMIR